jgi:hypothetical protein
MDRGKESNDGALSTQTISRTFSKSSSPPPLLFLLLQFDFLGLKYVIRSYLSIVITIYVGIDVVFGSGMYGVRLQRETM